MYKSVYIRYGGLRMKNGEYLKALRLAKRSYQNNLYKGNNPHLPALDDMVSRDEIVSEVYLGIMEIPLKKIVGTKTHSRSTAFAKNFMPLLGEETEFAQKWEVLCDIHKNEGIRDPIKVYEYLGRFYVLEGNKRASVLKYHEAVSIVAKVTRLIPKRDEDNPKNRLYYEYLAFYDITKSNYIWMSKEENYVELLKLMDTGEAWDDEKRMEFKHLYSRFRRLYKLNGGDSLNITTGDALLDYIKIYGYKDMDNLLDEDLGKRISGMMPELLLLSRKDNAVDVLTQPVEVQQRKSFFASLSQRKTQQKLKVAFVYAKTIETSGWSFGHELGRNHIEEVFKDRIETTYVDQVPEDEGAYPYLVDLVNKGYDVIFTTTPTLINITLKAALEYPHVKFLNCSENRSYKHLRTYYGRIYEARFLTGLIAGALTETNDIGYVANYPIAGVISGMNAFALGAKLVNPKVKVHLIWSKLIEEDDKAKVIDEKLRSHNVDLVSSEESILATGNNKAFGLYSLGDEKEKRQYIATPLWHWGKFYEKIIKSILDDSFDAISSALGDNKAINYWWGLSANVVDILYSGSQVPDETKKLIDFMRRMISIGEFHPFTGPIKDETGEVRLEKDEVMSNEDILSMDWLVEYIEGYIPSKNNEELDSPIVDMLGVKE